MLLLFWVCSVILHSYAFMGDVRLFIWNDDIVGYQTSCSGTVEGGIWNHKLESLKETITTVDYFPYTSTLDRLGTWRCTYKLGTRVMGYWEFSYFYHRERTEQEENERIGVQASSAVKGMNESHILNISSYYQKVVSSEECKITDKWTHFNQEVKFLERDWHKLCVYINIRTSLITKNFINNNLTSAQRDTLDLARSCFSNSDYFDFSLLKDTFSDFNSFGLLEIKKIFGSFKLPPRNDDELSELVNLGLSYTLTDCEPLEKGFDDGIVFYCHKDPDGNCDYTLTHEGAFLYTAAAIRIGKNDLWCTKIGLGPVLCTPGYNYSLKKVCSRNVQLGEVAMCYKVKLPWI